MTNSGSVHKTNEKKVIDGTGPSHKQSSVGKVPKLLTEGHASTPLGHICIKCPPLSPCAAMNGSMILSNRYSKNQDKNEQAERYINHIQNLIERYKGDDHASKYLTDIYSLMLNQSYTMNEFRQNNNRRLDEEDTIWKGKKTSLEELKKSEIQNLEDMYTIEIKSLTERRTSKLKNLEELSSPVTLKGSVTRLIGVGGLSTLIYSAQKEIMNVISIYIPNFAHSIYLAFFVSVGGAVLLTSRILSTYVNKKLRISKERFNDEEAEIKQGYNEEKQAHIKQQEEREELEFKKYTEKKNHLESEDFKFRHVRAAFVYLETFKLCESF